MNYDEVLKQLNPVQVDDLKIGRTYTVSGVKSYLEDYWYHYFHETFDILTVQRMTAKRFKIDVVSEISNRHYSISPAKVFKFYEHDNIVDEYMNSVNNHIILFNLMQSFDVYSITRTECISIDTLLKYVKSITDEEVDGKLKEYNKLKEFLKTDTKYIREHFEVIR